MEGRGGSTFLWWDRAPKSAKKVKAISSLLDPRTQTAKKGHNKNKKKLRKQSEADDADTHQSSPTLISATTAWDVM